MDKNNAVWQEGGSTSWGTPDWLFETLDRHHNFTVDVCASANNYKVSKWYGENCFFPHRRDGLAQNWDGETVFMNPPYGRSHKTGIYAWVEKAAQIRGGKVVAVLPCRPDTQWWHRFVLGHANIEYLYGRVKFVKEDGTLPKAGAGFPSAIVIWDHKYFTRDYEGKTQ